MHNIVIISEFPLHLKENKFNLNSENLRTQIWAKQKYNMAESYFSFSIWNVSFSHLNGYSFKWK